MSRFGLLVVLIGLCLVIILIRAAIRAVSWIIEEYVIEPREIRRLKEGRGKQVRDRLEQTPVPVEREPEAGRRSESVRKVRPVVSLGTSPPRKPSALARLLKSLRMAIGRKNYDQWVAAALSEDDLGLKIKYLRKASDLDPTYAPAWGLLGNALFDAGRFEEAIGCLDRSLEMHPSALLWYKKGQCCHRLQRREEAIRCLDEAMRAHPDSKVLEDASRLKKTVEAELQGGGTIRGT